ncbi:MAG: radical SAM protein [Deltaproteobacteria bacterium]|nr:radical SAM protein [Deltaproteobacteria bacterium]
MIRDKIIPRARVPILIIKDRLMGVCKPRIVVLVVNNACNFKCKYCFGGYHERSASADFTTEELKAIIDDLHNNGTVYATVHGGETLLRKDIGEIVRYMKGKGWCINLITNGALLPKKIEEIKMVDGLCISLDGREENNDLNRGKGSYAKAIKAIELVKDYGIPLRVQSTLTKYTKDDIRYMAELAKRYTFHLEFSILFPTTPETGELSLTDDEIRNAIREIIKVKKEGFPIFISDESLDLALDWPVSFKTPTLTMKDLPVGVKPIPCGYTRHKFTIDADGRAFPCFPLMGTFDALNVKEVGVKKAFEHVVQNTKCVLCPFLTQNDWNFMMALKPRFLVRQIPLHLKEIIFHRKHGLR